jgi:hypothetical protein
MRWKALFFMNKLSDNNDSTNYVNYGIKTAKCPPYIKEMSMFEKELLNLVKNIKFRKINNAFQEKISRDIKSFHVSPKTLIQADKTSNMYILSKDEYNHLLKNAITSTYKKADQNLNHQINTESKRILINHDVFSKIELNSTSNCFFTLKDHKVNFLNNPTVRLLNPAKNEVGRISKIVLSKINSALREKLALNQWQSSRDVINWFQGINDKHLYKFLIFDVTDFYPSINAMLLNKAIEFADQHSVVNQEDIKFVLHARKSLLFNNGDSWIKKNGGIFDVTMGAFDGAEVCELVGIFILYQLSQFYNKKDLGLYRDDGLAVFKERNGQQMDKIKKHFVDIFKINNLHLSINCNMKIVNFLDLTLNLESNSYRPYSKPDSILNYIHVDSNHPPSILKSLPRTIELRLSTASSNKEIFENAAPTYQDALLKSGFSTKLNYQSNIKPALIKNRKRNIIWYNPPFSKNVATKLGSRFLNIVDVSFPVGHLLHKIFNRNTIKISYSCMPNLKSIINSHNHSILHNQKKTEERTCNCINKSTCIMKNQCLSKNVVYQATVSSNKPDYIDKVYIGISETPFKLRYANHLKSFNSVKYINDTELSKEVWSLKEKNFSFSTKWKIIKRCRPYNPSSKICNLCLNEKFYILSHTGGSLLNKRNELISKCRHKNKFLLSFYDTGD